METNGNEGGHRFSQKSIAQLDEIITHYPERRAAMLPALWIAQREYDGYLPPEALQEVADRLERPLSEVQAVASFYTMYNFRKRGRHHLEVCTCLSCAVRGAYEVMHKLEKELGISAGEVTVDGEFSIAEVECLDFCGAATVVQVGDQYFGNVTAENVDMLLDQLRNSDSHTPVELADALVKIMTPGGSEAAPA